MREKWIRLPEFPAYSISTEGRVINSFDIPKQPSLNQRGIAVVNLSDDGRQHIRSLAVIVANTFLYNSTVPRHFDTPIHLNGDRMDCRVDNLMLRPRWFAIKYHQQFGEEERAARFGFRSPVLLIETDEVFETSWDAATKYGLLDREIFLSVVNQTYVFPQGFHFEQIEEDYE